MLVNQTNEKNVCMLSRYNSDCQDIEITLAERLSDGSFFHIIQCTYRPNDLIDDVIAPFYSQLDNPNKNQKIISFRFENDAGDARRMCSFTLEQARDFTKSLERLLVRLQEDQLSERASLSWYVSVE
jgi:hypothetical protein